MYYFVTAQEILLLLPFGSEDCLHSSGIPGKVQSTRCFENNGLWSSISPTSADWKEEGLRQSGPEVGLARAKFLRKHACLFLLPEVETRVSSSAMHTPAC